MIEKREQIFKNYTPYTMNGVSMTKVSKKQSNKQSTILLV
jgi:hypothetical protein